MAPTIHVLGGGTFAPVAPHLSLAARGTGKTALRLAELFRERGCEVETHLTSMGDPRSPFVTNADVAELLARLVADPSTKMIVMSCAMVDFEAAAPSSRRIRTADGDRTLVLTPAAKVIRSVRATRKDVFLVGFKHTSGASADEQYLAGLELLKTASCNLVLANDAETRLNVVVTPEQARYHESFDRDEALRGLVEMAVLRRQNGVFTRSTVVPGDAVPWSSPLVPPALRTVVEHCIARGAYKPFLGATVGHFAVKIGDRRFLTSRRKTDFNRIGEVGLVLVETRGDDEVVAHGHKPSVGGQSQRIVFRDHPGYDCIVHFHCPTRPGARVRHAEQRPFECGSHACGRNTSEHLVDVGDGIRAVMLDRHGPNVVFSKDVDPATVIAFIEASFDLEGRTDGVDQRVTRIARAASSRSFAQRTSSTRVQRGA